MAEGVDTLSREGLLRTIFGEGSKLGDVTPSEPLSQGAATMVDGVVEAVEQIGARASEVVGFTHELLFYIVMVVTMLTYLIWIVRYISHRQRGDYSDERWIYGDEESRNYGGVSLKFSDVVLSLTIMMGLITLLISLFADWVLMGAWGDAIDPYGAFYSFVTRIEAMGLRVVMMAVASYLVLSILWFALICIVAGQTVSSNRWSRMIVKLKSQFILPIMLYFMPFVIFTTLFDDNEMLRYVVVIEAVSFVLVYILRSFLLFVTQKISILQWFLYLCGVEILPITVVWAVLVRSVSII